MPVWLQIVLSVAGAISGWRWVVKPARRMVRGGRELVGQLRQSKQRDERIALELAGLAGAVVTLSTVILHRTVDNEERLDGVERDVTNNRRRLDQLAGKRTR